MNDDTLIIFVIYYSLFNKKLFENESEITKHFPKNVFGIFSTVRRFRKIKSYPVDIHGCIGYWDTNFQNLHKQTLYNNLLRVAHDSVWTDSRNQYFTPIETEPDSTLELDFMLNPVYNINKQTGIIVELNKPFTNNIFGIIIQTKDKTQKATYLPNVFPNISWKNLVLSIKHKANITSDNFELFAYKITQIKSSIINMLSSSLFTYICVSKFTRLLIDNMKIEFNFPFIYSCKNNVFEWNENDDVRNISALSDVIKYTKSYPNIATKSELKIVKQKIVNILHNIEQYSSQSLSFLGYVYPILGKKTDLFCKKLLEDLPFAEPDFEKPEIVIGLNKAGCIFTKNDLHKINNQFVGSNNTLPKYKLTETIFKINWTIQMVVSFNRKPDKQLLIMLEDKVNEMLMNITNIETNYIAVAFEALCFAYKSNGKKILLHKIFELLFELEHRKQCQNTLYAFLNKNARVDITEHVLNGLIQLQK